MATTLGLDEAGRGCVIGDLVVGGFLLEDTQIQALMDTGATDSKKLSQRKRERILAQLPAIGTCSRRHITPAEIDDGNLNQLEEAAFISLILEHKPDTVIIDAPTHPRGIPAVLQRLQSALKSDAHYQNHPLPTFIIEPKADLNYPAVSAASIVAKVQRDNDLVEHQVEGSGYPSDPKTRRWLKNFIRTGKEFPACVRKRWGTIDNLRVEVAQEQRTIPWEDPDSDT
jgi:ribonuclease HII